MLSVDGDPHIGHRIAGGRERSPSRSVEAPEIIEQRVVAAIVDGSAAREEYPVSRFIVEDRVVGACWRSGRWSGAGLSGGHASPEQERDSGKGYRTGHGVGVGCGGAHMIPPTITPWRERNWHRAAFSFSGFAEFVRLPGWDGTTPVPDQTQTGENQCFAGPH
jgi:hypothetical protein